MRATKFLANPNLLARQFARKPPLYKARCGNSPRIESGCGEKLNAYDLFLLKTMQKNAYT
jgi:hypothetical protein